MAGHRVPVDGFSLHFYTDFRNGRGRVHEFDSAAWYDVIREGLRTEEVIDRHWTLMGKFDKSRRTKLVIDEWGVWYTKGDEIAPTHILSQPATLRDAIHTAVTFDVFNRNADKVSMTNVAQTINCLHSLFLSQGDKYVRTPVYHVFDMYRPHMGARLAPLKIQAPQISERIPAISGSASLRDRQLAVTLANPSLEASAKVRIKLAEGNLIEGRGRVLTHADMRARNTFDRPDEVKPAPLPVQVRGGRVEVALPKQSIASLDLRLS
jgi:alpha-N-arabinofuranosidase